MSGRLRAGSQERHMQALKTAHAVCVFNFSPERLNVWDFLPFNMGTKYHNNVILSGHHDQQSTCITKRPQLDAYSDSNSTMCDVMGWTEGGFQRFTDSRASVTQQLKEHKEPDPGKKKMDERGGRGWSLSLGEVDLLPDSPPTPVDSRCPAERPSSLPRSQLAKSWGTQHIRYYVVPIAPNKLPPFRRARRPAAVLGVADRFGHRSGWMRKSARLTPDIYRTSSPNSEIADMLESHGDKTRREHPAEFQLTASAHSEGLATDTCKHVSDEQEDAGIDPEGLVKTCPRPRKYPATHAPSLAEELDPAVLFVGIGGIQTDMQN
ncbi:hypothetical protein DFH09DRAFT_1073182 [Mycena vulgaris]|nr:hypothetical protein DFH09DRAFT_1073182 [Mycena vulgaris]